MGNKCFKTDNIEVEVANPYPKFTYVNSESALMVNFISPEKKLGLIVKLNPDQKLPFNSLVCKISKFKYFILGGLKLLTSSKTNEAFVLDFQEKTLEKKEPCTYIPYGGSLFYRYSQVYLIGSSQDSGIEYTDNITEKIPDPFRPKSNQSLLRNKILNIAPILRYSMLRNRWKEVEITDKMLEKTNGVSPNELPNEILLPGTFKIDSKIYFIGGLVKKKENIEPNKNIYTFDLDTRKVFMMSVEFNFEPLTELKCACVSSRKVIIMGGYNKNFEYNRNIFKYIIDIEISKEDLEIKKNYEFVDNHSPVGKYKLAVFFGYPDALLFDHRTQRLEYLDLSCLPMDYNQDVAESVSNFNNSYAHSYLKKEKMVDLKKLNNQLASKSRKNSYKKRSKKPEIEDKKKSEDEIENKIPLEDKIENKIPSEDKIENKINEEALN
jgi:hypothetical protein